LRDVHGLHVLALDASDRRILHDVIYRELCVGIAQDGSRQEYRRVTRALADRSAECILFGCTEIELLVRPEDAPLAVCDTAPCGCQK
jgi:aspartate racemase